MQWLVVGMSAIPSSAGFLLGSLRYQWEEGGAVQEAKQVMLLAWLVTRSTIVLLSSYERLTT
jgi:hypothetical protein